MELKKLSYNQIPFLSSKDLAYINLDSDLSSFYKHPPTLEGILPAIELKQEQEINRNLLVEVLQSQYDNVETSTAVINNIDQLLHSNTFTIITAHQPCLFTGPLYFIYKIASTIHLTNRLNEELEDYRIIPLFIMGGEDHDFDEMNHLSIEEQKVTWNRKGAGGPVGRMNTEGLDEVILKINKLLDQTSHTQDILEKIKVYFGPGELYGRGMMKLVNYLFKDYGLVILNMDSEKLKREFIKIMKDDIHYHSSFKLVKESQDQLLSKGIEEQAFVREINLFYVTQNKRTRIERFEREYQLGDELVHEEELFEELEKNPQNFSPNVILRPIYQEKLLPNIAYIGGGGEIAYWLERKTQFEHYDIPFPILIRRNSVLFINQKNQKLLNKSNLELEQLFVDDVEFFISNWVKTNYDASLEKYKTQILNTFEEIKVKSSNIDASLGPYVGARSVDIDKIIDQIEGKLVKAAKLRSEIVNNRIRKVYNSLFPDQSLQERKQNFLRIYANWGPVFINYLVDNLDPFDRSFIAILE